MCHWETVQFLRFWRICQDIEAERLIKMENKNLTEIALDLQVEGFLW